VVSTPPTDSFPPYAACTRCGYDARGLRSGQLCPECGFTLGSPGIKDGVVVDERPCLQCGYSLARLPVDGRCPECSAEVIRSLQGNLLVYSAPPFVRRLSFGATCILGGVILFTIWIGTQLLPAMDLGRTISSRIVFAAISVFAGVLSLAGWWLLSSPDPALVGQDRSIGSRKVLRLTLLVAVAAIVVGLIAQLIHGANLARPSSGLARRAMSWAVLVFLLNWPIRTFASLQYVRSLAMRIPSLSLSLRAKRLMQSALGGAACLFLIIAISIVLGVLNVGSDGLTFLLFLPLCGIFVGVLVWWAVYASLIAGLRRELSMIGGMQSRSSSATEA
jgi:predicted Zn-ribbon and HTH transcriptional regulator